MFEKVEWLSDRALLNGLVLRLEHTRSEDWSGGGHFRFYKVDGLVNQYERFFMRRPEFKPKHIFELGIFDGGSIAFWMETLAPDALVAIDYTNREDSDYYKQWLANRGLKDRVHTYWNTDQADKPFMIELAQRHLGGRIDLVLDDASHLYKQSRASFEALFPLVSPGGWYMLEDWAWDHWPAWGDPQHVWAKETRLTDFVVELIELFGSRPDWISGIEIYDGFVIVERGRAVHDAAKPFSLDEMIIRRPQTQALRDAAQLAAKQAGISKPPSIGERVRAKLKRLIR
jgi:hypothetical protein